MLIPIEYTVASYALLLSVIDVSLLLSISSLQETVTDFRHTFLTCMEEFAVSRAGATDTITLLPLRQVAMLPYASIPNP